MICLFCILDLDISFFIFIFFFSVILVHDFKRYKIYIEGWAWSVSEKYILSCDSVTLLVKPQFYDFFTRSLQPLRHYWPIRDGDKCRSIKFAVDWGNSHKEKVNLLVSRISCH